MCSNKVYAHFFPPPTILWMKDCQLTLAMLLCKNKTQRKKTIQNCTQKDNYICCCVVAAVKLCDSLDICCVCLLVALKLIWSLVRRVNHLWKSICE